MLVANVQVLNVVLKSRFKYCLNNQKPGSLTCEQNILPAVILSIINVAEYGVVPINGSTIAKVVIAAIVALPRETRRIAATTKLIINGDMFNPLVRRTISSVTFASTRTCLRPPAAPLINKTTAIVFIDELSNGTTEEICLFCDFISSIRAINMLISKDTTGLLIITNDEFKVSGILGNASAIVGSVINNTGSNINIIAVVDLILVFSILNIFFLKDVLVFSFKIIVVKINPPIRTVGIATISPYKKTSPIFNLKVLTIILGLGCGGNSA